MKKDEKLALWKERLQAFHASGQTCREWCQKHQIPVSTMTYWNYSGSVVKTKIRVFYNELISYKEQGEDIGALP